MIAVPGAAPVSLTDSRNCANWSRKLRQLSLPDPVLPASRPAVSPYPRRYLFHDHDDDLSLSRAGMSWNLDFLSMSISAGCVSDPGRGTWMVLLSAGILFCWAGSVDEDGIYGYLLRGGISSQQAETFNRKIVTVCRRRILQILDGDRTSAPAWGFLLLTPRAGLTPAAATVPVTPCPSHVTQAEETPALPEHSPRPPIPVCPRPAPWRDPASTRTWRFEPAKVLLTPSWLPQEFSSNLRCFP
jgi:hypothetical protein